MNLNQFKETICPSSQDEEIAISIIKDSSSELFVENSFTYGLFNDKYPLHLIRLNNVSENFSIFKNRISYNTTNDSYYENGITKNKYLEFWDKGALEYDNIIYVPAYGHNRVFLSSFNSNKLGYIIWKFDYNDPYKQQQEFTIFSLIFKSDYILFDSATVEWFIAPLLKNKNLNNNINNSELGWKKLPAFSGELNLSDMVKGESGFMLKVVLSNRVARIFNQKMHEYGVLRDTKGTFGLDVCIELIQRQKSFSNLLEDNMRLKVDDSIKKDIVSGLFNNKYKFNILPNEKKKNLFNHRISYNTRTDAYYENGITTNKYLKKWNRGALEFYNIAYNVEYNWRKLYLAREKEKDVYDETDENEEDGNHSSSGYIKWKFDYRPGNFIIKTLSMKLTQHTWHDDAEIKISIIPLATRQNEASLNWNTVSCDFISGLSLYWVYKKSDSILDLSSFVKGEYGFILRIQLLGNSDWVTWDKSQIFRQEMDRLEPLIDDDENFGMDIKVELEPDIICEELSKYGFNKNEIILNDQNTSDFIIKLKDSIFEDKEVVYHVHKSILNYYSEYFKGLFSSQMIETTDRILTLSEISTNSFENILNFMYTGQVKDVLTDLEEWIDLLYGSSRFIIPFLIQKCEKSISKYVNNDNVEEITKIATDCGAEQLLRYCQKLESKNRDALYLLDI
ncbi:unnamed protein product [Rhizophagus irregularis]|nr:unnamed protein product [Rhizophagus irregularis]